MSDSVDKMGVPFPTRPYTGVFVFAVAVGVGVCGRGMSAQFKASLLTQNHRALMLSDAPWLLHGGRERSAIGQANKNIRKEKKKELEKEKVKKSKMRCENQSGLFWPTRAE